MQGLSIAHVEEQLPGAIYIGRAIPVLALPASPFAEAGGEPDRRVAIGRYHAWLLDRPDLIARLPELRGRTVACWCRQSGEVRTPATVCHGDVLAAWLGVFDDDTLRWLGRRRSMPGAWIDELAAEIEKRFGTGVAPATLERS